MGAELTINRTAGGYQFWKDERTQDPKEWKRFGARIRELTGGEATLACARAGVTTGEWPFALREVFGEYRAADPLSQLRKARPGFDGVCAGHRHHSRAGSACAAHRGQIEPNGAEADCSSS
jgi:hypothetical protein